MARPLFVQPDHPFRHLAAQSRRPAARDRDDQRLAIRQRDAVNNALAKGVVRHKVMLITGRRLDLRPKRIVLNQ